ncbi:MAG: hypothetical protein ABJD97_18750 [Betaproteobacteria bacterium]
MNTNHIAADQQDHHDLSPQWQDDAFLAKVDDAALEQALKTVSCNPKDVSQFLRNASMR